MTTNMDVLMQALSCPLQYPRNKCGVGARANLLHALEGQMNARASDIFTSEGRVIFLEVYRDDEVPVATTIRDAITLDRHLRQPAIQHRPDPRQRFIFVTARDSRSPLRITREMLLQILTYHQVMPAFLDFVCPFGMQLHDDSHFSGFRSETCQGRSRPALSIPQLRRSGRHIEMCYNLRSVERTKGSQPTWSIRACSVQHKFDLEGEQSSWIIVKANTLMQDEVNQLLERSSEAPASVAIDRTDTPLAKSLNVHRAICGWAGDNWHRYVSELEAGLRDGTSNALYNPQEVIEPTYAGSLCAQPEQCAPLPHKSFRGAAKSLGRAMKRRASTLTWRDDHSTLQDLALSPAFEKQDIVVAMEDYKFSHLQDIQRFEDKTNGIILVLRANTRVVRDLQLEYKRMASSPDASVQNSRQDLDEFDQYLESICKDLDMQRSRMETVLRIAGDRKSLVQGILQYRNMRAMQMFAVRAQETTEDMHRISDKAVVETVSMKIITVITLLFLPGTFISTLMSTPIVHFEGTSDGFSGQNVGTGALKLYLAVTIPLTLVTLVAVFGWLAWFYRGRNKRVLLDPFSKV